MIKITYICDRTPDIFTAHALFSSVTQNMFATLKTNSHDEQPKYKVEIRDRSIILFLKEDVPVDIKDFEFFHNESILHTKYIKTEEYIPIDDIENGDFITVSGFVNYAVNVTGESLSRVGQDKNGKNYTSKKYCPIDYKGNFVRLPSENSFKNEGETIRSRTLKYLGEKMGVDFTAPQIDQQVDLRFELVNYKHFQKDNGLFVHSKTNGGKIDIHNVFYLHCKVKVVDKNKVIALQSSSFGRRRSYGFGNIQVTS